MNNGDTHNHCNTEYEHFNYLLIQRMGPAMQEFIQHYQITQRESEILMLLAIHGFTNREIAERCVISEKTVKNHLANIMGKIGIRSIRKLFSLIINLVISAQEMHSSEAITKPAFGQLYGESRKFNEAEADYQELELVRV